MKVNMGILDRRVRGFVIAPVALVLALLLGAGTVAGIVLLVVAGIAAVTAAVGFCAVYSLLHLDSRGHGSPAH
jgi:hypothetical protein